jgi:hypothetical protein
MRVVCQNTLMLAMEDGQKAYRVRHSKQMQFKLEELSGSWRSRKRLPKGGRAIQAAGQGPDDRESARALS